MRNQRRKSRPKRRYSRRRTRGHFGSIALISIFFLLAAVNTYVFFFRGGTSVHELIRSSAIQGKSVGRPQSSAARSRSVGQRSRDQNDDSIIVNGSMEGQIGLSSALAAAHLNEDDIAELIEALRGQLDMRGLMSTHTFEIRMAPSTGQLRRFTYHLSSTVRLDAARNESGTLVAIRKQDH